MPAIIHNNTIYKWECLVIQCFSQDRVAEIRVGQELGRVCEKV